MLKHLLTVETAFHFTRPMDGVVICPSLPEDFTDRLKESSFTGVLVFADGSRQAVNGRFIQTHYSRRSKELPAWTTECFLEGVESVVEGTEIWWNEP